MATVTVDMPDALKDEFAAMADRRKRSMAALIRDQIIMLVEGDKTGAKLAKTKSKPAGD